MPLPAAAKDLVAKKLDAFIAKRMKPQFADKIRLSYTFRGNSVTIWENRAPWSPAMTSWSVSAVAQFRYNPKAQTWMLYWRDRNSRWHLYERLAPVKNIDRILAELDSESYRHLLGIAFRSPDFSSTTRKADFRTFLDRYHTFLYNWPAVW